MTNHDVRIFPTLEELSRAAAAEFASLARRRAEAAKIFCPALSGGSTPRLLYELLSSRDCASGMSWTSVHLFQVDERCVPPDDPQSNYRMIRETLLSRAPIPPENFHRMRAEAPDADQAARDYAAEIGRVLEPKGDEWPRLDLVLLGMGADGHTASLFPGSAALSEDRLWVRANDVEKFKMYRLTLTFPVINAAERVMFLVTGDDKAETLREVLEGGEAKYPAQRIRPVNGRVTWYLDQAVARLL